MNTQDLKIEWEFSEWAEKETYEAFISGVDSKGLKYEAIGIMGAGEIQEVKNIKLKCNYCGKTEVCEGAAPEGCFLDIEMSKPEKFDCLSNMFCDKQSKDCQMFCTSEKGCSFKCPA
jgi:hypothetical protein